jgi:hypothetical protein
MNFILVSLVSTLSSSVLLLVLGWLFRELIRTRLKASVEHEFNAQLSEIQSRQRTSEEAFKADLRQKETVIQALQGGALSALASRQAANDKRRLEAIDHLWAEIQALAPALGVVNASSFLKYDECMKRASKDEKFRGLFTMYGDAGQNAIKASTGWASRPHVTKMAWAYFVAYRAILGFYITRLMQLQLGLDHDFTDHDSVKRVVLAALPHQAPHIEQYGVAALHTYIGELESKLLDEFATMLAGRESDLASVEQAAAIVRAVEASDKSNKQAAAQATKSGEVVSVGEPKN